MRGALARRVEIRPAWSDEQKVGRRGQTRHPHPRRQSSLPRRLHRYANGRTAAKTKRGRSGGELLAAARAARRKHLAAADRRRADAKAVTTLAHELAGL